MSVKNTSRSAKLKGADRRFFISFFGPSGSGKSTCFQFAKNAFADAGCAAYRFDVALPLRQIQLCAYEVFGYENPGDPEEPETFRQDGALLGFLAQRFGGDLGAYTVKKIEQFLASSPKECVAVINTDCRNNAYDALKAVGFVFIRVLTDRSLLAERRRGRGDGTPYDYAAAAEQCDRISAQHVIANNGTLKELEREVKRVIAKILESA